MRRTTWKILLIAAAIIIAGGATFIFYHYRPVPVAVVQSTSDVAIRVFGLGTVEARIVSKIGFEVGAAIVELKADHGDFVKKGDVLARLHATEQEAKVAKTKAGILSAEANVIKAEANVIKAEAVFAQKQAVNRRRQELVARNVVAEQTAEEAKKDEDVASADLRVTRSEMEVAKALLADARAQHEFERTMLDHHVLTAPFDAIVVDRQKELGSVIKAGDTVFTLVAPETVWALAYIDESRAGYITEGLPAEVRLRSLPQQVFQARVARIGIESDRVSEERRVYVKCEQCPPRFHLGEQAEVLITVARLEHALLVPQAAVQGFDGAKGNVWTVEGGRLRRRAASFRHRTDDARLELVGGLPDDARVVATVGTGLQEGRAARIVSESAR